MATFKGTYYYSLDPKGRIMIPAPLREVFFTKYNNSKLYITNAPFDKCLHAYPVGEWDLLEEKLRAAPKSDEAVQFFMRRVIAAAVECELDKQGRIMIPYELRENAISSSEIVIAGLVDRLEIWDKARWKETIDPARVDRKILEPRLASFGI
ncbi:MAG: division/cell wall cluster transcriptional repressor MraZ [Nitrospirae bacterium]|nr:division/cell wall cluster transcriptional repressor MraZ [Nitrospirota bacterium]